MQKPIEPGCLVMCTHYKHFGFTTSAIREVPAGADFYGYTTPALSWELAESPNEKRYAICTAEFLKRIDGYDPATDVTELEEQNDVPAHA